MNVKVYFTRTTELSNGEKHLLLDVIKVPINTEYERLTELGKNSQEYKELLNIFLRRLDEIYLKYKFENYITWEMIRFENGYSIINEEAFYGDVVRRCKK